MQLATNRLHLNQLNEQNAQTTDTGCAGTLAIVDGLKRSSGGNQTVNPSAGSLKEHYRSHVFKPAWSLTTCKKIMLGNKHVESVELTAADQQPSKQRQAFAQLLPAPVCPKTKLSGRKSWPKGPARTLSMVPGSLAAIRGKGENQASGKIRAFAFPSCFLSGAVNHIWVFWHTNKQNADCRPLYLFPKHSFWVPS